MSTFTLAAEASVLSPGGPLPAASIEAGVSLCGLGAHGNRMTAEVTNSFEAGDAAGFCVLTRAGDALVAASSRLAGRHGPAAVTSLAPGPRQLETVKPGQVPAELLAPQPLEGLAGSHFVIPATEGTEDRVRAAMEAASVPHAVRESDGWIVVDVDGVGSREGWTWKDESTLLMLLTGWLDGESRTVGSARTMRARLLWALIAAGQPFEARWVPSYRPVECRVGLTERVDAFAGVVRVEPAELSCRIVEIEARAVLVDWVYVLPDR